MRLLLPLMALAALAVPAAVHAAVPIGPGGELLPRTGAELLEAADSTIGASNLQGASGTRIVLEEATYEVGRPIVLGPGSHLEGAGAGASRIVGSAAATTLLRLDTRADASGFSLQGGGEDPSEFALVELRGSARLSEAYVFVPDSLPNVTAADLSGAGNVLDAMEIESEALAPAVRAAAGSEISTGSSITGGAPALVLTGGPAASTTTLRRTIVQGSGAAASVVTVQASDAPLTVRLQSSQIRGGAQDAALLDLRGASAAAGSLAVDLQSSTIIGEAPSTAVRVQSGAERTATAVELAGLLSLGSTTTVDCPVPATSPAPTPAAVRIAGILRDGALEGTSACTIAETGRRTGDPRFRDADARDYAPRWGSVLIDAVAEPADHPSDATGGPRTSIGPGTPPATPTDIGSIEYVYSPPAIDAVTAEPADDQGLLSFTAEASDEDPDETADLRLTWTFPDGTVASGPTATWRATTLGPVTATLTATDVSGIVRTRTVTVTPVIPEPAPEPTSTRAPQQTLPEPVTLPRPTPSPTLTPRPGPQAPLTDPTATIVRFDRLVGRTTVRAARASGLGAARTGEASVQLETRRASKVLFTVRRRVDGRDAIVTRARFSVAVAAGTTTVHLSSRFGPARLRPGLHRVVALVQAGSGIVERRELFMRVVR